jgi:hypothetical protein
MKNDIWFLTGFLTCCILVDFLPSGGSPIVGNIPKYRLHPDAPKIKVDTKSLPVPSHNNSVLARVREVLENTPPARLVCLHQVANKPLQNYRACLWRAHGPGQLILNPTILFDPGRRDTHPVEEQSPSCGPHTTSRQRHDCITLLWEDGTWDGETVQRPVCGHIAETLQQRIEELDGDGHCLSQPS